MDATNSDPEGTVRVTVLVSISGQIDNVGDAVLRRALLRELRMLGPLVVNVAKMPDTYLDGLALHAEDDLISSPREWRTRLLREMTRGCVFAFNSGEMQLTRGWGLSYGRLAALLKVNRLAGGHGVHLGYGVRAAGSRAWRAAVRTALRSCDLVTWRDQVSCDLVGLGRVTADWAFAEGAEGDAAISPPPRDTLAVSLRGDRPPLTVHQVDEIREFAAARDLRIAPVLQAGRDEAAMASVARALGVAPAVWDGSLAQAEATARMVYARSSFVVTDRLHAAVMAMTEGTTPVLARAEGSQKIARTLAPSGLTDALTLNGPLPSGAVDHLELTSASVATARERLHGQRSELSRLTS